MIRKVVASGEYRNMLQARQKQILPSYAFFYPDPVKYYILTLEKIVI